MKLTKTAESRGGKLWISCGAAGRPLAGVVALVVFAAVSVAQGTEYYVKPGATDLSVASSYTTGSAGGSEATTPPGSSDEVWIPAETFAIAGDSASFTTLSGVKRVRPNDGAVLEFTIAENDTRTFEAPINYNGGYAYNSNDVRCYGKIVKKGLGTLILASSGKTKSSSGNYRQDYFTQIDLQQGTLKLPQHAEGNMYFGDLTMAEGTTLVTVGEIDDSEKGITTYLRSISGYGTVTNETRRTAGQTCTPYTRNIIYANEFHGKYCSPVKHWLDGRFIQYGHETGISHILCVQNNYGHLNDGYDYGVYSFEDVVLLGSNSGLEFFGNGAGFHYFGGVDATMAKNCNLYTRGYPAFFDAGWHGGLRCTGAWYVNADVEDRAVQKWLVLMGSNTVPCTIEGGFVENAFGDKDYRSPDGIPYTIVVQKLGSGTWRFKNNRNHGGSFAIEEGTLQFDSIAEKGVASALGRSTNLTDLCSVRDLSAHRVNYAFALGSTNTSAPEAVFEFTGSASAASLTRPLVLVGKGGAIRASGVNAARLGFGDVSARAAGETTLVIDGANTLFNTISGIADGSGKVSVVKDGEGNWYLSGTNTFSGDLCVKKGTLTVLGPKYTWFRFTVKQTGNAGSSLNFRQLALYDANGIRQNICLAVTPPAAASSTTIYWPDSDSLGLTPGTYGSFAFGSKTFRAKASQETYVDQLFSDVGNTISAGTPRFDGHTSYGKNFQMTVINPNTDSAMAIEKRNPSSWVPIVMRLTNGAPEIVAYDIESMWHTGGSNNWPKVASMEASVDGVKWDLVETNALGEVMAEHDYDFLIPLGSADPGPNNGNSNRWFSDGTAQVNWTVANGTRARPGKGFPMKSRADLPMPLQNVRSVSVAANATLKAEMEVVVASLKVDAAGAGTMDGFTFAADGTLDVVLSDALPPQGASLPGTYVNCGGFENIAGWKLKVNGDMSRKYRIKMQEGRIYILPRGTSILFK